MSEYADRDIIGLGEHYTRHVMAMTVEGLREKSDIAAELAWRDKQIERLRAEVERTTTRLKWFEDAGGVAVTTRVHQLMAEVESLRVLLREAYEAMREPTGEWHDIKCNRTLPKIRAALAKDET